MELRKIMATQVNMVNPMSGATTVTYDGFSWTMLFFGFFAPLFRGDFKMAAISFVCAICTMGFSWLVFPFIWNGYHRKALEKCGYVSVEQYNFRKQQEEDKRRQERREDREFMMQMKS